MFGVLNIVLNHNHVPSKPPQLPYNRIWTNVSSVVLLTMAAMFYGSGASPTHTINAQPRTCIPSATDLCSQIQPGLVQLEQVDFRKNVASRVYTSH